jgi:hypothetical protein
MTNAPQGRFGRLEKGKIDWEKNTPEELMEFNCLGFFKKIHIFVILREDFLERLFSGRYDAFFLLSAMQHPE